MQAALYSQPNGIRRATAAPAWSPLDLSPLFWLDASQLGLSNDDPVDSWTDESGTGRHFTSSAGERPLFKTNILNSLPILRFDGTDDTLTANGTSSLKSAAVVVKYDGATAPAYNGMLTGNSVFDADIYLLQPGVDYFYGFPADITFYKNGVESSESDPGVGPMNAFAIIVVTSATARNYTWMLGSDRTIAGRFWSGDYAEVIASGDEWDAATVAEVTEYLAAKWGISI